MDVAAVTVFRLRQKHCVVTRIERNIEKYIDIGRDRGRGGGKVSERGRERERERGHSSMQPTLLSCAQYSGRSILLHFLPTAGWLS